jgi:hypothetical protein
MPAPIPGRKLPRYPDDTTVLVKGRELNELAGRIEQSFPLPGPGLRSAATPDGVILTPELVTIDHPPFALVKVADTATTDYEITLEPGRVMVANPVQAANGGDGYDYFIPEIDGVPMDEEDSNGARPTLMVSPGEGVYCKVSRNAEGLVISPVEIVVGVQDDPSDHYQPADPVDDGHASEFDLIRILYLDVEDDILVPTIWRESDIDLTPFLWLGENVGAAARVYKEHAELEGSFKFRTLVGCWAAEVAEDGDQIKIEVAAENVGTGESAFGATLLIEKSEEDPALDICEQKLKIKSLLQGSALDARQIRITNEDEGARIHGNGKNGSIEFHNCDDVLIRRLEWEDGLIINTGDTIIKIGDCDDPT